MKVTDEIKALVPKEVKGSWGIYWNEKQKKFYVFRRLGYQYNPKTKRTNDRRKPIGSIADGKFSYGPSYLKELEIERLEAEVHAVANTTAKAPAEPTEQEKKALDHVEKAISSVEDVRQPGKVKFPLDIVLTVAILAGLAGYTGAVSIAIYWKRFRKELEQMFDNFPKDDISHDTVNRIFRLIDAKQFVKLVQELAKPLMLKTAGRLIHLDGQAIRAAKTEDLDSGRYLFNAFDSDNFLTLSHLLIDEKKNEISSAIDLLETLKLMPGDLVTADAMNTQRQLVQYLTSKGVGYCLAVKENHPKLHDEIMYLFQATHPSRVKKFESNDCDHGRIEKRVVSVIPGNLLSKSLLDQWPELKNGCLIRAENITVAKSKRARNSCDVRYFISSFSYSDKSCVQTMASTVRRHWSIENNLHWVLDMHFNQDRIQCTNSNYLSNRVALNKASLNTLKTTQRLYQQRDNLKYSIATIQQLCATPASSLETICCALEAKDWLADVAKKD